MKTENVWSRMALGALAGLAGTAAIQMVLKAHQKWSPGSMPPIREEPGSFMIRQATRILPREFQDHLPGKTESTGGKLLGMGYGMTFGALYGLVRPRTRRAVLEGALLGMASWAAGYLGWLPATKLMPPVWRQKWHQATLPIAEHALFGIATVAGHRWLKERART